MNLGSSKNSQSKSMPNDREIIIITRYDFSPPSSCPRGVAGVAASVVNKLIKKTRVEGLVIEHRKK